MKMRESWFVKSVHRWQGLFWGKKCVQYKFQSKSTGLWLLCEKKSENEQDIEQWKNENKES